MRTAPSIAALLAGLLLAACGAREAPPPPRAKPKPQPTLLADTVPTSDGASAAATAPSPRLAEVVPPPPLLSSPPQVWIVLTKATARGRSRVRVKGRWNLTRLDGTPLAEGSGLDGELTLAAGHAGDLAGTLLPAGGAELRPATEGDLRIDDAAYPGSLRIDAGASGERRIVVATDVETYVAAVVNSEVPASYPIEMQRTQAILARTYAMAAASAAPSATLVLADTGGIDQEFAGLAVMPEHRRVAADAVSSTRGLVLMDGGVPLTAYYHSSCGGTTCPGTSVFGKLGAQAALRGGVLCTGCATDNKYYRWEARIPGMKVLGSSGLTGRLERFAIAERTEGGRAVSFDVTAKGVTRRVRAPDFRLAVGAGVMRSTLLEVAIVDGGDLLVRGRGWGHGVGLCQMGARTMAQRGERAESIVAFYYPGAKLERRW